MAHEVISVWEKMGYSPFDINVETRCIASDGLKYVFILAERKGAENLWPLIGGTDAIHRVPTGGGGPLAHDWRDGRDTSRPYGVQMYEKK